MLVQFWTTWCQYCRRDQPSVENITESSKTRVLIVLAVDVGEPKKKVQKYLEDSPRSSKVVLMEDTNLDVRTAYQSMWSSIAMATWLAGRMGRAAKAACRVCWQRLEWARSKGYGVLANTASTRSPSCCGENSFPGVMAASLPWRSMIAVRKECVSRPSSGKASTPKYP